MLDDFTSTFLASFFGFLFFLSFFWLWLPFPIKNPFRSRVFVGSARQAGLEL